MAMKWPNLDLNSGSMTSKPVSWNPLCFPVPFTLHMHSPWLNFCFPWVKVKRCALLKAGLVLRVTRHPGEWFLLLRCSDGSPPCSRHQTLFQVFIFFPQLILMCFFFIFLPLPDQVHWTNMLRAAKKKTFSWGAPVVVVFQLPLILLCGWLGESPHLSPMGFQAAAAQSPYQIWPRHTQVGGIHFLSALDE